MDNAEWTMQNGQCRMDNAEWTMQNVGQPGSRAAGQPGSGAAGHANAETQRCRAAERQG